MLKFIKQAFFALLTFSGPLETNFRSLNDEPCIVRSTRFGLNPNELH